MRHIRSLRMDDLNQQCARCDFRYLCGGGPELGGMVQTYAATKTFTAPYPACEDFKWVLRAALWFAPEYDWLDTPAALHAEGGD